MTVTTARPNDGMKRDRDGGRDFGISAVRMLQCGVSLAKKLANDGLPRVSPQCRGYCRRYSPWLEGC